MFEHFQYIIGSTSIHPCEKRPYLVQPSQENLAANDPSQIMGANRAIAKDLHENLNLTLYIHMHMVRSFQLSIRSFSP